jgi:succinate dehydrogenase/fumarate reductase flavoprotein subunit
MPITIDQVKHWTRPWGRSKTGCIVVRDLGGWMTTACGSLTSGNSTTDRPPKVCRKCRAALKDLSLRPEGV